MVLTSSAIGGRLHFQILSLQTNCVISISIALREDPIRGSCTATVIRCCGKRIFLQLCGPSPFQRPFLQENREAVAFPWCFIWYWLIIGWREITSELVLLTWCQKRAIVVMTLLTPLHLAAPDSFPSFDSFANGWLKYGSGSSLRILEQTQELNECILRLTIFQIQSGVKVLTDVDAELKRPWILHQTGGAFEPDPWIIYRVVFLTGPPDLQYQNEKQVAANQD